MAHALELREVTKRYVGPLVETLSKGVVAWVAGKVYRVGILSTGKRPTLGELARWIRSARPPGTSLAPALAVWYVPSHQAGFLILA